MGRGWIFINGTLYLLGKYEQRQGVSKEYRYFEFFIAGSVAVLSLLGYSIFEFSANAAMQWGLLSPVMWGALIAGLASMLLMSKLTYTRQQTRDLS